MRVLLSIPLLLCACGGGGGSVIDARSIDARMIDGAGVPDGCCDEIDAMPDATIDAMPPDAAVPDAIPIDAVPPDAPLPCDPGPFTTGVSTLAGCETPGAIDGIRGLARFSNPVGVAIGPDGDVYVADFDNDRVRAIQPDGTTRTVVDQANFHRPFGVAFADDGTLYVSTDNDDTGAHTLQSGTIWRVDRTTNTASVVARDVGRARGLTVLPSGTIAFSDYLHETVSLVNPTTGAVTLLAGTPDMPGYVDDVGAAARFHEPYGMAVLGDGRLVVADYANNRLRAIALDGTVTTIAGSGATGAVHGAALTASFSSPQGVAVDAAGDVFITDTGNFVVRELSGGQVTTVVGSGTGGWLDSDNLLAAEIFGLEGLDVSADGTAMWIADGNHGEDLPYDRVRVVDLNGP